MSESASWQELLEVLELLISNSIGITEGCRLIVGLRHALHEDGNALFLPFVGVDSETDSFPLGNVRKLWSADGLRRADEQRSVIERHCKTFVIVASEALKQYAVGKIPLKH
jgi:hypothetical protein